MASCSGGTETEGVLMELVEAIIKLKKERNAVILAHNYQVPEVQDIADYVGDSLGLSIQASNTTAEVKAQCDICCTSGNAERIVREAFDKEEEIIFAPDQYLAGYISEQAGRDFIYWPRYCVTHLKIMPEDIIMKRSLHKDAAVIVHPECAPAVTHLADKVLSTEGMCRYARQTSAKELIVGTEIGILHRLKKENPEKLFYPASERAVCPNMKRTTLEKVLWSLEDMQHEIIVPSDISEKAMKSLQRMLDY